MAAHGGKEVCLTTKKSEWARNILLFWNASRDMEVESSSTPCVASAFTIMTAASVSRSSGNTERKRSSSKEKGKRSKLFIIPPFELAAMLVIFILSSIVLFCVYLAMPSADYASLKFPKSVEEIQILRDNLANYTEDYTAQVILGYCAVYIFMQTFMIPGTIFMSLLAGALFGVVKALILVVSTATAGASCSYFLSKLVGRPIASSLWPEKLQFFRLEVAKRRKKLLNYMLFLRITPSLPNMFINVASPIVDVPYHIFFLATFFGLIPNTYVTVRAGLALGELKSVSQLYDSKTLAMLFFIGFISIIPTLVSRNRRTSS